MAAQTPPVQSQSKQGERIAQLEAENKRLRERLLSSVDQRNRLLARNAVAEGAARAFAETLSWMTKDAYRRAPYCYGRARSVLAAHPGWLEEGTRMSDQTPEPRASG